MVLSAGDCHVCGVTGEVLYLVSTSDPKLFVACNQCEGASRHTDKDPRWLAQSIREYAPAGFRPATEQEVVDAGADMTSVRRVSDGEFAMLRE